MQIQKVQSNQTTFGTTVRLSSNVAKLYKKYGNPEAVISQIKNLEQNGKNDILVLTEHGKLKGSLWGELTEFHNVNESEPYMTKTRFVGDVEDDLNDFYNCISEPCPYFPPKKIKIPKELLPYII